ncbi:putative 115 kDa protein in type-1 retrotransposable element R1DM [Ceratocystis lukuohia]|uniref:115 kDa protein in type-1 retrotransposable element R1DM n=1 Tax=Ceratocystis lukuohia TaxID=2019550 RepID=A0ABR4M8K7_9PEZI
MAKRTAPKLADRQGAAAKAKSHEAVKQGGVWQTVTARQLRTPPAGVCHSQWLACRYKVHPCITGLFYEKKPEEWMTPPEMVRHINGNLGSPTYGVETHNTTPVEMATIKQDDKKKKKKKGNCPHHPKGVHDDEKCQEHPDKKKATKPSKAVTIRRSLGTSLFTSALSSIEGDPVHPDLWFVDSCASFHVRGNRSLLANFKPIERMPIEGSGGESTTFWALLKFRCTLCWTANLAKKAYAAASETCTQKLGDRIHADLIGPITPASSEGYCYVLLIIGVATRHVWTRFLVTKQADNVAEHLLNLIKTRFDGRIRPFHVDGGTEFKSLLKTLEQTAAQIATGISVQAIREQRNLALQSTKAANAAQTASNATENLIIEKEQANRSALNAQKSVDQVGEAVWFIDAWAVEQLLAIIRASQATEVQVSIEESLSHPCLTVYPKSIEHYSGETHGVVPRRNLKALFQIRWIWDIITPENQATFTSTTEEPTTSDAASASVTLLTEPEYPDPEDPLYERKESTVEKNRQAREA